MDIKEVIEEAESCLCELGDFSRLKHLFSKDVDIKSLAKLRQSIGRLVFKMKASQITEVKFPDNKCFKKGDIGKLVKIRPCGEKYNGKTYLGISIGDYALGTSMSLPDERTVQLEFCHYNPATYVPELNEIIYGCGSWWSKIESIEELKDITDEDIESTWYVKLAKELL